MTQKDLSAYWPESFNWHLMQKINAIDLDRTLIPFDSFRLFVLTYLKQKNYLTTLTAFVLFRRLRLLQSKTFKHKALKQIRNHKAYQSLIQEISAKIMATLRPGCMQAIARVTDQNTLNILISASPEDYVSLVAGHLGWPYLASKIENNKFIHCHGPNKITLLQDHYPRDKYIYNFAISDSLSDLELLKMFNKYELVER
jgi:phosphoserine phosphatase